MKFIKFAITAGLIVLSAFAQAPQGQRNTQAATPANIDYSTAKKMAAAAEALALKEGAKVGIAIVDANGDLVYLVRLDGASPRGSISSEGKARAAILFGQPTKALRDAINTGQSVTAKLTLNGVDAPVMTINQGGLPIIKDGKVIGGIGAGGAASADDERYAQAGLDAAFPQK